MITVLVGQCVKSALGDDDTEGKFLKKYHWSNEPYPPLREFLIFSTLKFKLLEFFFQLLPDNVLQDGVSECQVQIKVGLILVDIQLGIQSP